MSEQSFAVWTNFYMGALNGGQAPSSEPGEIVKHCAAVADQSLREVTARWPAEMMSFCGTEARARDVSV